jgi:hypothetical protein
MLVQFFESSGDVLSLTLPEGSTLSEQETIEISRTDLLIALELQLGILDQVKRGDINSLDPPVDFFLENNQLPGLKCTDKLDDRKAIDKDATEKSQLDNAQIDAVEKALSLLDGEFLLIIGPPGTARRKSLKKLQLNLKIEVKKS